MPGMPGIPPLPPPKALFIFGVAKLNEQLFDVYTSGVTSDERNQNRTVYGSWVVKGFFAESPPRPYLPRIASLEEMFVSGVAVLAEPARGTRASVPLIVPTAGISPIFMSRSLSSRLLPKRTYWSPRRSSCIADIAAY
jgi:hypothetical protein